MVLITTDNNNMGQGSRAEKSVEGGREKASQIIALRINFH